MSKLLARDSRLFRFRVFPKRPSDAEYVERIRKGLRIGRWVRWFSAAVGLCMLLIVISAIQMFVAFLNNPAQQFAFGASIIVGLTFGFLVGNMAHTVAMSFFGQRQEKLLVDCWDALDRLLAEGDGPATDAVRSGNSGVEK